MTTIEPTLMRGFTSLRGYVGEFLSVEVPALIDVARQQWDWSSDPVYLLPYPVDYNGDDDITLVDKYPTIGFAANNDRMHTRIDVTDVAALESWATFNMRIWVLAASPNDENGNALDEPLGSSNYKQSAVRLRDDLVRIVHAALLQTPSCGRPDQIRFEENSLRTDYLGAIRPLSQNVRYVAGAVISADFKFREHTYETAHGVVNIVERQVGLLYPAGTFNVVLPIPTVRFAG